MAKALPVGIATPGSWKNPDNGAPSHLMIRRDEEALDPKDWPENEALPAVKQNPAFDDTTDIIADVDGVEDDRDSEIDGFYWYGDGFNPADGQSPVLTSVPTLNLSTNPGVPSFVDGDWLCCRTYRVQETSPQKCNTYHASAPTSEPAAPTNVSVTNVSSNAQDVDATIDADASTTSVERKQGVGGNFQTVATGLVAGDFPWRSSGLSAEQEYCYRLESQNDIGASPKSSTVCETTPAESTGDFPNEPAGTILTNVDWSSLSPSGWNVEASGSWFGGEVRIDGSQSGEPQSPSTALEMLFPQGTTDLSGRSPARARFAISPRATDLYAAWTWRPSDPWDQHPSGVDKKAFLFHGDGEGQWVISWHFTGQVKILFQRGGWGSTSYHAHNISSLPSDRGRWYFFEQRLTKLENLSGGEARWRWRLWGSEYSSAGTLLKSHVLRADHNITIGTQVGIQTWSWEPTWGGTGDHTKSQDDFFWWGHTKLVDAS